MAFSDVEYFNSLSDEDRGEQIRLAKAGLAPGPMTHQYFGGMPPPDPVGEGYELPPGVDPNQQSILQGGPGQFEEPPLSRSQEILNRAKKWGVPGMMLPGMIAGAAYEMTPDERMSAVGAIPHPLAKLAKWGYDKYYGDEDEYSSDIDYGQGYSDETGTYDDEGYQIDAPRPSRAQQIIQNLKQRRLQRQENRGY